MANNNNSLTFLKNHCEFQHDPHDCYVLLAVSRKKDVPHITNSKEVVFREVLRKPEDLHRKYTRLKLNTENYRDENNNKLPFYIYITVNARDGRKASLAMMQKLTDCFYEESLGNDRSRILKRLDREFISLLMKPAARSKNTRYFLLDIDTKNSNFIEKIYKSVKDVSEINANWLFKNETWKETRHGWHLKTSPFNIQEFKTKFSEEELKNKIGVKTNALMFVEYVQNNKITNEQEYITEKNKMDRFIDENGI